MTDDSNYTFPDPADVPTIRYDPDDPFDKPETKTLFVQYDSDEWEHRDDMEGILQTINWLFGTDVQIALLDERIDFLTESEVRDLLTDLLEDEDDG